MKHLSRVVWSEGMYLGPHHFQAQNRYFEDAMHFTASSLWFAPYGLIGWELDHEALRNGTLALIHARGLFPDGLTFHMPDNDALPPVRNIGDQISPVRDSATVLLAIARQKPDGINVGERDSLVNGTRYVATVRPVYDENTGRDEKAVKLAGKNIRLLLDSEITDDVVTLPVARVMRDGAGHFVFDPNFVPPCLSIAGSDRLMTMLRRLIEILETKSATLTRRDAMASHAFSQQELARFWLLHAVNSGLAPLKHLFLAKRGHPEELYLAMGNLAGALCTFGIDSDARNLPLYNHDNLTECFEVLDQHIRAHLETTIPTTAIAVQLNPTENYFFAGNVTDPRALGSSPWVLAIESSAGDADLIARVPTLVKICSQKFVSRLVQKALPGLTLVHLPVPPAAVSPRMGTQYFAVNKSGPCWDHIVETREVGVYVPGDVPNPRIELFAVLDSRTT